MGGVAVVAIAAGILVAIAVAIAAGILVATAVLTVAGFVFAVISGGVIGSVIIIGAIMQVLRMADDKAK